MSIVKVFTALALFGPALPFFYVMMFVTGVIRMHASKYEIIFLKKRTLPLKAKSINLWLSVIDIVCYLSVVTNVGTSVSMQPT